LPAIADVFSLTMDELMGIPETKKTAFPALLQAQSLRNI